MARRIRVHTEEVSLAYNPANKRKFIMTKEAETMYEELIAILKTAEPLSKETELDTAFTAMKLSDKAVGMVKGALRILSKCKDELPKGIFNALAKVAPDYEGFVVLGATKEELRKEVEVDLTREITEKLRKEFGDAVTLKQSLDVTLAENKLLKDQLVTEKDAKRMLEIASELKKDKIIGDIDKMAKVLFSLEKISPDLAKDAREEYKKSSDKLAAFGLDSEEGSAGDGSQGETAWKEIQAKKDDLMTKDAKLSEADALTKVLKENPGLYNRYLAENKSKGRKK
jgi:hypothetical protein